MPGGMQTRDSDDALSQSPRPQLLNLNRRLHDFNLGQVPTFTVTVTRRQRPSPYDRNIMA